MNSFDGFVVGAARKPRPPSAVSRWTGGKAGMVGRAGAPSLVVSGRIPPLRP
ncbi:MAG: hypothetical protein NTX45_04855 [Proteobacteria bacterium]|nr:hypothetical protein [Pseudomonadota bacterium]